MSNLNLIAILFLWFMFSAIGGIYGFFATPNAPPLTLGLSVVLPVVLFGWFYAGKGKFHRLLQEVDLRVLIFPQIGRVLGLLFIVDYYRGLLPPQFAWPAGLGDIAIGVTAPVMVLFMRSNYSHKLPIFRAWNILGILDLVVAVTLGILHSQSSFGILAGSTTTQLMSVFPRNLVPTFLVPLFVILHIIALDRYREPQHVNRQASAAGT